MEIQLLTLVMLIAQTPGYDSQMTKKSGLIQFKDNSNSVQNQSLILHPPQNRTNVALTIYTVDFKDVSSFFGSSVSIVGFPDGSRIDFPKKKYLDNPYCRVYVKGAATGQVTCKENVEVSKICKQPSIEIQTWPPTISAEFEDYAMLMYYEFINCPGNETGSTDSSMGTEGETETDQTTPFKTTITTATTKQGWKAMKTLSEATETDQMTPSATIFTTTNTAQRWKEKHQSSAPSTATSTKSLLYTVIALAVLLIIVLILLAVAAWKIRKLSRNASTKTADIAMNHFNDVTKQATFGHESSTKPDASSVYAKAEEGDGNVPQEKQTVDNEQYHSTEKQDVINELYDCTA